MRLTWRQKEFLVDLRGGLRPTNQQTEAGFQGRLINRGLIRTECVAPPTGKPYLKVTLTPEGVVAADAARRELDALDAVADRLWREEADRIVREA